MSIQVMLEKLGIITVAPKEWHVSFVIKGEIFASGETKEEALDDAVKTVRDHPELFAATGDYKITRKPEGK